MSDEDYLIALEMQMRFDEENRTEQSNDDEVEFVVPPPVVARVSKGEKYSRKVYNNGIMNEEDFLNATHNMVHPQWELLDPTPDINALFGAFDAKFFQYRLKCVTLEWSRKMYSCAGICYSRRNRFGMDVTIRLSEPLLKLRSRKDLVETLLHEMIHAYCFVLNIREGNGGHGPNFKKIMNAINQVAGTNITVYHTFHDEVEVYRQHWWRCNGCCQNRAPFFGYVKRTSNRPPGPYDTWWANHKQTCGGFFLKIKGPDPKPRGPKVKEKSKPKEDIRKFISPANSKRPATASSTKGNVATISTVGSVIKGAVKTNGGGTMLVKPTIKAPSSSGNSPRQTTSGIASLFPPSSYPGSAADPFNIEGTRSGVVSAPGTDANRLGWSTVEHNNSLGRGYSLDCTGAQNRHSTPMKTSDSDGEDVRNRLRDIWSKRFGGSTSDSSPSTPPNGGEAKRQRLCSDAENSMGVQNTKDGNDKWTVLDDEVMFQEPTAEVIAISSDEEGSSGDDEEGKDAVSTTRSIQNLNAAERERTIKQEILEDTDDINDEDIILIDDEYIDSEAIPDGQNVDTSVIDEFFSDDTLLHDFLLENDVVPSGSRRMPKPEDDIITCPVCQNKMKRQTFSEHLNGCTGIAIKVRPSTSAFKKLAKTSTEVKPKNKKPPRSSVRDVLRNAGYTEVDLAHIVSGTDDDEDSFNSSRNTTATFASNTTITNSQAPSLSAPTHIPLEAGTDEDNRMHRQRNLYKTSRQCPKCGIEVEEIDINNHLDECLDKSPPRKKSL